MPSLSQTSRTHVLQGFTNILLVCYNFLLEFHVNNRINKTGFILINKVLQRLNTMHRMYTLFCYVFYSCIT